MSVGFFSFLFTDFSNLNISLGAMAINCLLGYRGIWPRFFSLEQRSHKGEPGYIGCFQ